jgi:FSR family fosmidomycin resistance protein-like MFS transporter
VVGGADADARRREAGPGGSTDGSRSAGAAADATGPDGSDRWGAFGRLTGALVVRSIVFYAFNTFVPLFWIDVLGQSKSAGGLALTLMLLVGAGATLLAGRLGDRFSRRAVVLVGFTALVPLTVLFTLSRQPLLCLALLIPLAVALYLPSTPMVVMGQQYLPRHVGTAAGVTLGLALSVGGVMTPVVGAAAEAIGLRAALLLLAGLPLIAAAIALTLPPDARPVSRVRRISG